jgi:prepilin-type N-terminal cleavage/methylation domain-containing protein
MKFASMFLSGASRQRSQEDYDRKTDLKLVGMRGASSLCVVIATPREPLLYDAYYIHARGGHQGYVAIAFRALMRGRAARCAGFTLIETLAALALASLIIMAGSALLRQGLFTFDRGAETVDQEEELSLAVACLTRDFAAARYVRERSRSAARALSAGGSNDRTARQSAVQATGSVGFTADLDEDGEPQIVFATGGGRAAGKTGTEIVSLSVEHSETETKLIRRRGSWSGPMQRISDVLLEDPVVLLRGRLDFAFSYSQIDANDELAWRTRWIGENSLPHSVRLTLRDSETGVALQAVEFPIFADAPASCASGAIKCLRGVSHTAAGTGR